jgi:isopentenyldiphosphate isomerase
MVEEVDANATVLRIVTRAQMRAERLRHRSVFIVVRSHTGKLLIHRRALTKDFCPGWWDMCVGGVVGVGEDWDDAAERELAEELGVVGLPLRYLGAGSYTDDMVKTVGRCYEVVTDGPFEFADGEIIDAEWIDLADLDTLVVERDVLPDSLQLIIRSGLLAQP